MKKVKVIITILFFAFITAMLFIQSLSKKVSNNIYKYMSVEAKRFGNYVINSSIDSEFIESLNEDIFKTTKNSNGEIQILDFKTKEVNKILERVSKKIQKNLLNLENGKISDMEIADTFKGLRYKDIKNGVVCELPMGTVFSNFYHANNGPIIPVKLNFIGQVLVNLKANIKTYGINNAYFEVMIHVEVTEQITMPMQSKEVKIENDIPLTMKVIQGKVPEYYPSGIMENSKIFSLPVK